MLYLANSGSLSPKSQSNWSSCYYFSVSAPVSHGYYYSSAYLPNSITSKSPWAVCHSSLIHCHIPRDTLQQEKYLQSTYKLYQ